jgi:hypothetical protein
MVHYVTTDPSGRWTGSGAPILPAQVDENFYELREAIDSAVLAEPVSIASIDSAGSIMTIHYSNGSSTTIDMPVATYNSRGEWAALTVYAVGDSFYVLSTGSISAYVVAVAHTSGSTFDDTSVDVTTGKKLYSKILTVPNGSVVAGGAAGAVFTKLSNEDGDAGWVSPPGVGGLQNVSGVVSLDRATAEVFRLNLTGDVTATAIANFGVAGQFQRVLLEITNTGGNAFTFPAAKWANGGGAPTVPPGVSVYMLYKLDASSLIYANEVGRLYA